LLCAVQFLDILDSSIVNVALPSIQRDLRFSQQNLQWVLSGYLLTYGGFLLFGGRLADLLGRRRVLAAGLGLFAVCSLTGGLAANTGMLVGAGVFLGGVLSAGPGWRWVLLVNLPVCLLALFVVNEQRARNPLAPLSILRIRGLAAADATRLIALAAGASAWRSSLRSPPPSRPSPSRLEKHDDQVHTHRRPPVRALGPGHRSVLRHRPRIRPPTGRQRHQPGPRRPAGRTARPARQRAHRPL